MSSKTMRHMLFAGILALLLSGCLSVYKLEIQQGNVITQEMIDKLKPGMTPSQVRYVMGTPLITDPFHQDRWDYYYYLRRSDETTGESQRVTLLFKNNLLFAVKGDTRIKYADPATEESAAKPVPGNTPSKSDTTHLRAL
jgi:outer membrane protein assembly factor BamE